MSYGLEIKNKFGSVIINETSQNFLPTSATYGTASAGASYPPTGVVNTRDLVFSAPAVNQSKQIGITTDSQWNDVLNPATSYRYVILKRADLLTAGSGYGLQVFDAQSDLCYDSTVNANYRVLSFISLGSRITSLTLPSPSTTFSNFDNIFVLTNNTTSGTVPGITYTWTSSTTGRISFTGSSLLNAWRGIIIEVLK